MDAVWWLFCSSWLNDFYVQERKIERFAWPVFMWNPVRHRMGHKREHLDRPHTIRTSTFIWAVMVESAHGLSYTKADGVQCVWFLTSVAKNSQFLTAQNYRFTRGITKISAGERPQAARLLRSWVRIHPGAWMFVCCECCVLSGRGLCDELITRPQESYRLWCVVVCDLETSRMRRS